MRKASMLLLVLLAFGAWALAQNRPQALQITHGPVVEQVSSNSVIVAWTTNVPSSAVLHYGTNPDPKTWNRAAQEAWGGQQNPNQSSTHRVTVQGLQPNTTYYLQAESGNAQGTGTGQKSQVITIRTTAQGTPPVAYPNGR